MFFYMIASPTSGTLDVLERQDLHLMREIARLVILACATVTMIVAALPASAAVLLLAVAGATTYMLYWLVSLLAIVRAGHRGLPVTGASDHSHMPQEPTSSDI
jgi:hypothetical protein